MKIIADTATLLSPAQGREMGITIIPVCVLIDEKSYRDYEEIGEKLWERFNENDPVKQGMYYGSLANVFGQDEVIRKTAAYKEYVKLASELFSHEYEYIDGKPVRVD